MKYEEQLSRNIISAVQKVKDKFDSLCTQGNFYFDHFAEKNKEFAKSDLIRDKTGYFSELVFQEMGSEIEELIRTILLKKDWFEGNPYEYVYPMLSQNKPSEEEIKFIKQRNQELKKFYSLVGDECNTASTINFNERI